jgi:hypothetical protein
MAVEDEDEIHAAYALGLAHELQRVIADLTKLRADSQRSQAGLSGAGVGDTGRSVPLAGECKNVLADSGAADVPP